MRIRFVMTVLMLLGLGGALKANAQNWTGNVPSSVIGKQIVLYNVATGWYLNGGNLWGTQLSLSSGVMFFYLSENTGGYSVGSIGWGGDDENSLYTNGGSATLNFVLVNGTIYNITCTNGSTTYYLVGDGQNNAITYTTVKPAADDQNAQWKVVTESDMENWFLQVANAANTSASSADGTYLIKAPNFGSRSDDNLKNWITVVGSTTSNLYTLSENHKGSQGDETTYDPSTNTGVFIGNGYGGFTTSVSLFDADTVLFNSKLLSDDKEEKCERYFGGLWTTSIHGAGKVYQKKTNITKSGWYEIACKPVGGINLS